MQIEKKRLKSGFELPVFGFGTWAVGGRVTRDPYNNDRVDINAIKTAIDMGITHIDTAEFYAGGHAEKLVGEAINGFDRSSLIIATKVWHTNLHYSDLINSFRQSLKRLHTDYVDIYIIHYPNPSIDIGESMKAMDYLVEKGYIKNIGLSNFSVEQFSQAQKHTENKIVCNQLYYNLANREPEKDGFLEYALDNDVMLVAWRPIEKGSFSRTEDSTLKNLCKKYGKSGNQIAINWLISQENVATISKSRDINHLKENLGALGWKLERSDVELLNRETIKI
ncbi:MAG: aldo/keto reductase [Actinomycetota bacterium]|nr:aldo/keto reductase [Actinomycetota bacterium]